jgi:hypothetical protein
MEQGNSYDKAKDGQEITREYLEDYNARAEWWALDTDFHFIWDAAMSAGKLRWSNRVATSKVFIAAGERLRGLNVPTRSAKAKQMQARREGKARLAWWDAEHARLKPSIDAYERHHAETDAAAEQSEEIWGRVDDITEEILATPAVTLAGAMAQLAEAARQIRVNHSDHEGNVDLAAIDLDQQGVLNAHAALVRLLPGSAVQS